jgi:hypothetical protein
VIELLDFKLRGSREAPGAAARLSRVTERYLDTTRARDVTAVVTEVVSWLASDSAPSTLALELSVTSTCVRVAVTASHRVPKEILESNELLRRSLPVTSAVSTRYGLEASRRTRVWAEFDRRASQPVAYSGSEYSR